jgi:hypothetical protein
MRTYDPEEKEEYKARKLKGTGRASTIAMIC